LRLLQSCYEGVTPSLQAGWSMAFVMRHTATGAAALITSLLLSALCAGLSLAAGGSTGRFASDPSFAPGPPLPVGSGVSGLAIGDFDGNGSPDLVVANSGDLSFPYAGYRSNLRILLNDGAGRFHMAPGSPFKGDYGSLALADFNRDGKLDGASGTRILLGDGTGHLRPGPAPPGGLNGYVETATAADVNGDGRPDLVVAVGQESGGDKIRILLGDGAGRFSVLPAIPPVTGGGDYFSFATADFNGDGKTDLVVAEGTSNKIALLLGDGTGAFGAPRRFSPGKLSGSLVVGDFKRDGKPDIAVSVNYANTIAVLPGDGAGGFGPVLRSSVGEMYELTPAELDGDGQPDLAAVGDDGVEALLGDGTGHFRHAALSPFIAVWGDSLIGVADFNGNKRNDVLSLAVGRRAELWPDAPRSDMILFQTPAAPPIASGRTLGPDVVHATRSSIYSLAADGKRAAVCGGGIAVWSPGGKAKKFRAACGEDLALSNDRVAWIAEFSLPNEPEVTLKVFTKRLSDGKRQELGEAFNLSNRQDIGGYWLGQLLGGGPLIAFNDWVIDCIYPPPDPNREDIDYCEESNPTVRVDSQDVVISGGRSGAVKSGPGFYPLRAVGGGRLALEPAGAVVVVAQNGSRVGFVPADDANPPRGIALSRTRLAVLRTSTLDLYNPAGGAKQKSVALGRAAGLKLAGVNAKLALLRGPHQLMLVRLHDGKVVSLPLAAAAAKSLVEAKLTAAGLFYAYNLRRAGRVVFEPTAKLLRRF
jgi:FG-GAP-like repeat